MYYILLYLSINLCVVNILFYFFLYIGNQLKFYILVAIVKFIIFLKILYSILLHVTIYCTTDTGNKEKREIVKICLFQINTNQKGICNIKMFKHIHIKKKNIFIHSSVYKDCWIF